MFEDAEEFVRYLHFRPQKRLQALHPFEVGNDHASGITENVRDHKDLVPTLLQNQVCVRRGRTVGGFSQDPALSWRAFFPVITRSTAAGTRMSHGRVRNSFALT